MVGDLSDIRAIDYLCSLVPPNNISPDVRGPSRVLGELLSPASHLVSPGLKLDKSQAGVGTVGNVCSPEVPLGVDLTVADRNGEVRLNLLRDEAMGCQPVLCSFDVVVVALVIVHRQVHDR